MILNDRTIYTLAKATANSSHAIVEVFQRRNGAYLFGIRGLILPQLRYMEISINDITKLGIITPDDYIPNEIEAKEILE